MADIFISYKSERRPAARHMKKVLDCYFQEGAEECVWYDYGLIPGHDFEPRILDEIERAKVVLVLWCGMAVKSPWVEKEAREAKRAGKLLPCRLESCQLPADFAGSDTINLSEWDGAPRSPMLDRLLDDIGRRIGREAVSRISRLRDLEEDWQSYGAPSLAHFALGKALEPEATAPAPQASPILGPPPPGLSANLARHWEGARLGDPAALDEIAWHLAEGKGGFTQDLREAARLFELAAAQGHAGAQCNLGVMYEKGIGVQEDKGEAIRLFKLAADSGDAKAQHALASRYEFGWNIAKDDCEAVRLYKLAADQGYANSQFTLGFKYANGSGVAQDYHEALHYYQLAAEQGHTHALCALGALHANGRGVARDEREAIRLWRLAADQGDRTAQHNLSAIGAL